MRHTTALWGAAAAFSFLLASSTTLAASHAATPLGTLIESDTTWQKAQQKQQTDSLPHVDPASFAKISAHYQGILSALTHIDRKNLPAGERENYDVLQYQATVMANQIAYKSYEMPVNSDTTFWSELSSNEGAQFTTETDYQNALKRLGDIPRYFQEQTANMRAGLQRGFTAPHVTLVGREGGIRQVAEAKTPEATPFFAPFRHYPATIPRDVQEKLTQAARDIISQKVIPTYRDFLTFFTTDYVPHARQPLAAESLPDGKRYYQSQIYEFTTTSMTAEAIHAFGLAEMQKVHQEMMETMAQTGFKGSFSDFLKYLRTDDQFYAKTPMELLKDAAWIAKEFDGKASRYFGLLPRNRFGIEPVPEDEAPFYTSARGGEDTYYVNTYNLKARALYSLPALTLHESAPGHSMQLSLVAENTALPEFRKNYISAYGEGWALYCERLGDEMGFYRTAYEKFGMLSYQAWRIARLVVDTGIHAKGWTREQAQAYLHDNTALADHEIETEIDRYISWPGQALSYYLGEAKIWDLRHRAEHTLGKKFDIRRFHDAILETGSVPLSTLDAHISDFITKESAVPK
ncbi:DUF885 family protein [Acetobacter tropicalis]|uniref:DUF885 domain-containing protein n=1 Tax=Acetobacter tropicalis TaxID=104102 RepID=UPI00123895A8|nr:DUF885 family protein [Acetobacter tropicalis]KAA8384845.1 DUF885 family protein [Acetobacter tropicalis]KAA8391517.1 DUF885 family protein [Acetobacter tropicalis]MDO8173321.1 DUF885 family protein [Acetobacter tropicalis]